MVEGGRGSSRRWLDRVGSSFLNTSSFGYRFTLHSLAMWEHSALFHPPSPIPLPLEDAALTRQPDLSAPWSWTFQLLEVWENQFLFLINYLVCSILLYKHKWTKTDAFPFIYIFLNFFPQYFVVIRVQVLYTSWLNLLLSTLFFFTLL